MKLSRTGLAIAATPPLFVLLVYYSLAVHMHQALGGWPTSIGERGFPASLILHAKIDSYLCVGLILSVVFIAPVAAVVCAVVRRWRPFLPYIGAYVLFSFIVAGLTQLAPAPFLNWWWD